MDQWLPVTIFHKVSHLRGLHNSHGSAARASPLLLAQRMTDTNPDKLASICHWVSVITLGTWGCIWGGDHERGWTGHTEI